MPVKYEGLFRLYPSLAECEANKERCLVGILRHKELKGRATPLEFVRWDNSLTCAMREILGGTKNLSDFPFWGEALPVDYCAQAKLVVYQYVHEMRKTKDLRLALLEAQGEVLGHGLTAAVVFGAMKELKLSAWDLGRIERAFSRLKYAAPKEGEAGALGRPCRGFGAFLYRAAAMFV